MLKIKKKHPAEIETLEKYLAILTQYLSNGCDNMEQLPEIKYSEQDDFHKMN